MAALIAAVASVVLAAGALAAARFFARAAIRYRILTAAFVVTALVGPAALGAAALRPAAATAFPGSPALVEPFALPAMLLAVAFAAALLFELVCDVVRLRRIKRKALPIGTVGVRNARIGVSSTVPTPTAIGYFHPAIVVPAEFRDQVDAGEWDAVVAHECAHLARGDDWAKALQSAVLRAGWWLPGLWLLSRGLDLERELASDERAVDAAGARRFAACLLRLATGGSADRVAPALWGRRSHVAIRVERLLRPMSDPSAVVRAIALGAFSATAVAVLTIAIMAVPSVGRHAPRTGTRPTRIAAAPAHRVRPLAARIHRKRPPAAHATIAYEARTVHVDLPVTFRAPAVEAAPVVHVEAPTSLPPVPAQRVSSRLPERPAVAPASEPASVAYLPRLRCATCFGPLHAQDGTWTEPASPATPSPAPYAATTTVAAEDTGSGPASPHVGFLWLRLPRALVLP